MKKISTFSQQINSPDYDLYIVNDQELAPGNEERVRIYADSCTVLESGKKVYCDEIIEAWIFKDDALFIFHTESRDSSGRVLDVMLFIQGRSQFEQNDLFSCLLSRINAHVEKAILIKSVSFEKALNVALQKVDIAAKKSLPVKLMDWLLGILHSVINMVLGKRP